MKYFKALICFLLFSGSCFATDTTWFDADWKKTDKEFADYYRLIPEKTGGLYHIMDYYSDGILQGDGWSYSDTTEIWEGRLNFYHRDGSLQSYIIFKDNVKTDTSKQFHSDGKLAAIMYFKDNELEGTLIEYFNNGKILQKAFFVNGKLEGDYFQYHENGKVKVDAKFINGLKVDTSFTYFENGIVENVMQYKNGLKHGTQLFYNESGILISSVDYVDDLLDGNVRSYHNDGTLELSFSTKENERHGILQEFYPDGTLRYKVEYDKGIRVGEEYRFFENGQTEVYANYKDGLLDGVYKIFDENGNATYDCLFSKGEIDSYCNELTYNSNGDLIEKMPIEYSGYIDQYIANRLPYYRVVTVEKLYFKSELNIQPFDITADERKFELRNDDGIVIVSGWTKNNILTGKWEFFNSQGELFLTEHYENGLLNGNRIITNSKGAVIKEIPYKQGKLHGMIVEWNDKGEASLNLFYKNGQRLKDRTEFYQKFYSKGVTTKGNVQIINIDELEEAEESNSDWEKDDVVVFGILNDKSEYDAFKAFEESRSLTQSVAFDTSFAKSKTNFDITILKAHLDKKVLETNTKDFAELLLTLELTADGLHVIERPESYEPKRNELAVFLENNEGDISNKKMSVCLGIDVKNAILNESFDPIVIISLFDGGLFDVKKFPGLYLFKLLEEAANK